MPRQTLHILLMLLIVIIFILIFWMTIRTKQAWHDEAWFACPAYNLIENGHMGTTIKETAGIQWVRIDEHTYWQPPLHFLAQAGWYDIFIARYNPDGTLAWAKRFGGAFYNDIGNEITTLSDNSTVVTGWFVESATFGPGEPNETVLISDGNYDIFVARYNPDGTLAWAKRAGGASGYGDGGQGITTLSDDSTVVTGRFGGSATFGPFEPNETILTSAGNYDIFIARFAP